MLNRLTKLREELQNRDDNGFTLIELLVVVVIIGILIAIAIPLYLNYTKGSHDTSADSDVRGAISALELCNSQNGSYPTANFTVTASGTAAGTCTTQKINVSSGTMLVYTAGTTTGTSPNLVTTDYMLVASNSSGNSTHYCYNSAKGGPVQNVGTATSC